MRKSLLPGLQGAKYCEPEQRMRSYCSQQRLCYQYLLAETWHLHQVLKHSAVKFS